MIPFSKVVKRQGANLPHWELPGGTYAVTFRMADSLPAARIQEWQEERRRILAQAETIGRKLYPEEQARVDWLESDAMQEWLDAGHGSCALRDPACAKIVADVLKFFDGQRHDLAAWCVMPNHVHAVVRPRDGFSLSSVLHTWKSFSAKALNKQLARSGEFWQGEPYDHLIRDHLDFRLSSQYVLDNPAKARLKDWAWVGGNDAVKWP